MDYFDLLKQYSWLAANPRSNRGIKIITALNEILAWQEQKRVELVNKAQPIEWANIGIILNDPYILVLRDFVEFPGGRKGGYFRVLNQADLRGGQGVVVLAEMNKKFLILHLFRHPTRSWSYEVPRGFGEPGVLAEEQAKNEIREEVSGEIDKLVDLGIYYSNTGLEGNKVKLFYAILKSFGEPAKEEGIDNILWVSLAELEDMIANVKITDGFTIAAYTRAKLRGLI